MRLFSKINKKNENKPNFLWLKGKAILWWNLWIWKFTRKVHLLKNSKSYTCVFCYLTLCEGSIEIVVQMHTYMAQFLFGRFVSLVGQVALCQVTYLEGDILQELKRRRQPNKDQVLSFLVCVMQWRVKNKFGCLIEFGSQSQNGLIHWRKYWFLKLNYMRLRNLWKSYIKLSFRMSRLDSI